MRRRAAHTTGAALSHESPRKPKAKRKQAKGATRHASSRSVPQKRRRSETDQHGGSRVEGTRAWTALGHREVRRIVSITPLNCSTAPATWTCTLRFASTKIKVEVTRQRQVDHTRRRLALPWPLPCYYRAKQQSSSASYPAFPPDHKRGRPGKSPW